MKHIVIVITIVLATFNAFAQEIISGEYFFNTDPGYGNGTEIIFDTGEDVEFELNIPFTDELPLGVNKLYFRFKNADNVWSLNHSRIVLNEGLLEPQNQVSEVRYYFDTVNEDNANQLVIGNESSSIEIDTVLDLSNLSSGIHYLYVQAFDGNNAPGLLTRRSVLVSPNSSEEQIESLSYTFSTASESSEVFEYQFSNPATQINETVFLDYIDLIEDNNYTLTVQANGANGSKSFGVSKDFVFKVNNSPMALSNEILLEMNTGDVFDVAMDTLFTDDDLPFGDLLTYTIENVSISSVNDFISWTQTDLITIAPDQSALGTFTFDIQAKDMFSEAVSIPVNLTVSADNTSVINQNDSFIKVYPNPANDILFVETSMNIQNALVSVINMQGQVVITTNLTGTTAIDIDGLESGIYLVRVQGDEFTMNKRILVQ
jgi:hypothetical protein